MSQGVSVGFAPAVTSVVMGGTAAAAPVEGEAAGGGLFATLLALLGAQPANADELVSAVTGGTVAPTAGQPTAAPTTNPPALLFDMAKAAPMLEASVQPQLAQAATTEEGKTLLKTMGDALIALGDALDAGQPPDPALEKKLDESLNAVAAYLGIALPAPAPVTPAVVAQASGTQVLPDVASAAPVPSALPVLPQGPATPVVPQDADDVPSGTEVIEPASKSTILPLPTSDAPLIAAPADKLPAPNAPGPVADEPATEVARAAPATEVANPSSAASEPAAEEVPAPILKLVKLIENLADKLQAQSPELATKLEALAGELKSGKLPEQVAAVLTGETGDAEPELARIIEALSAPKPATTPAAASIVQPFVAPSLKLPEPLTGPMPKEEPVAADKAEEIPAEADEPDSAKARIRPEGAAELKQAEVERKPATSASPAATAKPDPAPAPPADPTSSAPQQLAGATAPAAGTRAVHAAYQTPVQQVNLPQVAFEMVRQFQAGNTRFQIRLDPPELGRIDVKLDVDKSGTVNARMTVDRPETLDLMQRDQRALQQALQQAGLDSSKTSLEFSLRQNPFAQQQGMGDGRGQQPSFLAGNSGVADADQGAELQAPTTIYRGTASAGGVNLFV